MPGMLELTAQLTATPSGGGGSFPSGITNIPFGLNPPTCKSYGVATGAMLAQVNSPSSFEALGGIGSGGAVTQATTLYLRTVVPVLVQITRNNNGSGTTTSTQQVSGLFILESPIGYEVQGVAVQGVASVEYFAAGND